MQLDDIKPTFDFLNFYTARLIDDIPDDQLAAQPLQSITMNHPAWTLAHLAWASDNALKYLNQPPALVHLKEFAGIGSTPSSDRSKYPGKSDLLKTLTETNAKLWSALTTADPALLAGPAPERMQKMFPTLAAMLVGLLTSHFASHIGQLSAWRRAMGMKSVF